MIIVKVLQSTALMSQKNADELKNLFQNKSFFFDVWGREIWLKQSFERRVLRSKEFQIGTTFSDNSWEIKSLESN